VHLAELLVDLLHRTDAGHPVSRGGTR
jgi:hypothetical protein